MAEGFHAHWTSRVSRRSALALPGVLGLAGCSLSPDYVQNHDPYFQAIKKDPMYLWKPQIPVTRALDSMSMSNPKPGDTVDWVAISLTPADVRDVPALLEAATQARSEAGYSKANRRYGGRIDGHDFYVECTLSSIPSIHSGATPSRSDKDEVVVVALSLAWEP